MRLLIVGPTIEEDNVLVYVQHDIAVAKVILCNFVSDLGERPRGIPMRQLPRIADIS
jgi:hypothetical protein